MIELREKESEMPIELRLNQANETQEAKEEEIVEVKEENFVSPLITEPEQPQLGPVPKETPDISHKLY